MEIKETNVKGLIFCGGEGVRLRPLTYYFQKVMIPIGTKQKPLLEYVLKHLKYHKISDISLLVNYKANQILNYFGDGSRFGLKITYIYDKAETKGTLTALFNAFVSGNIIENGIYVIYYGDILSNVNLSDLLNEHIKNKASVTIALSKKFPIPVGVAEVSKNKHILKFVEKPMLNKPVSIGILIIEGKILKYIEDFKNKKDVDIMADFIPFLIKKGEIVLGFLTNAFWYDVGTTERYEKLDFNFIDKQLNYLLE